LPVHILDTNARKSKNQAACLPEANVFLRLRWKTTNLTYNFFYTCDGISYFSTDTLESTGMPYKRSTIELCITSPPSFTAAKSSLNKRLLVNPMARAHAGSPPPVNSC
jgi:hypothetical protein